MEESGVQKEREERELVGREQEDREQAVEEGSSPVAVCYSDDLGIDYFCNTSNSSRDDHYTI